MAVLFRLPRQRIRLQSKIERNHIMESNFQLPFEVYLLAALYVGVSLNVIWENKKEVKIVWKRVRKEFR